MQEQIENLDKVEKALAAIKRTNHGAELTLSNGITLEIKAVPPMLVDALNAEFTPPDPPMWMNEQKGREEPNPDDPEYLQTIGRLEGARQDAVNNLILAAGTKLKLPLPEGREGPEGESWLELVKLTAELTGKDIEVPQEGIKRYLAWLRYYAIESGTDFSLVMNLVLELAGISEREVLEAMNNFRGDEARGADPGIPTIGNGGNGNPSNRASRRARARA